MRQIVINIDQEQSCQRLGLKQVTNQFSTGTIMGPKIKVWLPSEGFGKAVVHKGNNGSIY